MTGWYGPAQYSSMLKIHSYENLNNVCLQDFQVKNSPLYYPAIQVSTANKSIKPF